MRGWVPGTAGRYSQISGERVVGDGKKKYSKTRKLPNEI